MNRYSRSLLIAKTTVRDSNRYFSIGSMKFKNASPYDNPVPKDENVNTKQKLATWQHVQPKGRGFDKKLEYLQKDDSMISDPKKARLISETKMQSLKDSLTSRGFARESKSYTPPADINERVEQVSRDVLHLGKLADSLQYEFKDPIVKFKFITECIQAFDHDVPSSELHKITTVRDVVKFFSTPVRGVSNFDSLVIQEQQQQLPRNLHIIPEYIRYNPDDDQFFGGKDAFPKMPNLVRGLKAQKKYDNFKTPMEWPDI